MDDVQKMNTRKEKDKLVLLLSPGFLADKPEYPDLPLNNLCLGSFLKEKGYNVVIVDQANWTDEIFFSKIRNYLKNSICVGISAMTAQVPYGLRISKFIKKINPDMPIIWGGKHPTIFPEQTARNPYVDVAVRGEGEQTLLEIVRAIEDNDSLDNIKGITFLKDNELISTPDREFLDMNKLPFLKYELVDITKKLSMQKIQELKRWGPQLLTSRGCPHRCAFCLPKGTLVLMSDITWKPIQNVKIGDYVVSVKKSNERRRLPIFVESKVTHTFKRNAKLKKIVTTKGVVFSTKEHPWLSEKWRWRKTSNLKKGQILRKISIPSLTKKDTIDYKKGYLIGVVKGDGCLRHVCHKRNYGKKNYYYWNFRLVTDYESMNVFQNFAREIGISTLIRGFNPGKIYKVNKGLYVQNQKNCRKLLDLLRIEYTQNREIRRGFLAGIYDSEGSWSKAIRISNIDVSLKQEIGEILRSFGFKYKIEKRAVRLLGGQSENIRFISLMNPKVAHKKRGLFNTTLKIKPSKIKGIYDDKTTEVYNLETTNHNFIANGFVTHNCINNILKEGIRFRKPSLVLEDMERLKDMGINKIEITDECFLISRKRTEDIIYGMINNNLKIKWHAAVRADAFNENFLNEKLLKNIKEAGCVSLSMGVESGSQRVLDQLKKDIKVEDTIRSAELLSKAKIRAYYSFMIGVPGETKEDIEKTLKLIYKITKIHPDSEIFGPQIFRPFPGSDLFNEISKYVEFPKRLEDWEKNGLLFGENYRVPIKFPWLDVSDYNLKKLRFYGSNANGLSKRMRYRRFYYKVIEYFLKNFIRTRIKYSFYGLPFEYSLYQQMRNFKKYLNYKSLKRM